MHSWTRTLVLAAAFITYGGFAAAQSPSAIGIRVVGAFGAADAKRVANLPSTPGELVGGMRISAGKAFRRVTVSAETEMNVTSIGHGETFPDLRTQFAKYSESRRDLLWSGLGGLEIWEGHRKVSAHFVAGISWVKPTLHAYSKTYDVAHKTWGDAVAQDDSSTTWAPTAGADLLFHFGDWAAGPSFRWYDYKSSISPYASPTNLKTVVLTAGYHF